MSVAIGRGNSRCVHALVLEAFVGPCPPGQEGLHRDGVHAHNALGNLHYGTRQRNSLDKKLHGVLDPSKPLSTGDVVEIGLILRDRTDTRSQRQLAKEFGVSESMISKIKLGKAWQHV
jgi:hypothetical protein